MPLVRALHGESVDGVEMVIRNRERPDGILVSVDGRPLDPSAGQHGAVAVFHDITELRRYENDLAVFAGVVAHDLKAPLAVVRGHCETVAEDLGDVELGRIVSDVLQDRLVHLRPQPETYVGELPPVRADPAMLRHVLDNLIGN